MALLTHSGLAASDLGARYIKRDDISEILFASLVMENNLLGLIPVGEEVVDLAFNYTEDKLNNNYVTDATIGGITSGATSITVSSAADAALLDPGVILMDDTIGDYVAGEQLQVTQVSGTTITVTRGYGGTSAVSHANAVLWKIVHRPTYQNSDLGRDMSRARIVKTNNVSFFEGNVNIAQEQLSRAQRGAAPGVPDELKYQFNQRLRERLREMNTALVTGRPSTSTGDYQTGSGLVAMLDGTATFNSTGTPLNAANATLSDSIINTANKTITRNGGVPDWLCIGVNGAHTLSQLYNDRIRIDQSDESRGFKAKYFDSTLHNSLRFLMDGQIPDGVGVTGTAVSNTGVAFLLDSGRFRIRPLMDAFFYTILAPSFRDGDAVRFLSKWGLEGRNTGSDAGAASIMIKNLNFLA